MPPDSLTGGVPQISFRGVGKTFVSPEATVFTALTGVDLDVEAGTFVSLIGPSGCGKSTLLHLAAGLFKPSVGAVRYAGQPVHGINTAVGYMTQADSLLPWRKTLANVRLPLELRGNIRRREADARALEALERVNMSQAANKYPGELSGGMRKRVALARMLAYGPRTFLMDEPFGALDAQLRTELQGQLADLCCAEEKTVLFVTHDLEEAIRLSDRIVVMGTGPGRVLHVEDVKIERPRSIHMIRTDPRVASMWSRLYDLIGRQSGAVAPETDSTEESGPVVPLSRGPGAGAAPSPERSR